VQPIKMQRAFLSLSGERGTAMAGFSAGMPACGASGRCHGTSAYRGSPSRASGKRSTGGVDFVSTGGKWALTPPCLICITPATGTASRLFCEAFS
jgi:hypothetical protein